MGGGGNDGDGDWAVLPCPPLAEVTLALVGKIGTGKSATANCILGKDAFASERSYVSVTETCQKSSTTFQDGCVTRTVNVIDTPGLFDMEISIEDARKEIVKCIEMSKHGIHALLMVFSAESRFSCEEQKTVESIKLFFGDKILDHVILVFTRGDEVGNEVAWKKMLAGKSPEYLKNMLKLCQNRVVLFDNKTSNVEHREMQRKKLLDVVDSVISNNYGRAFSCQMFSHVQEVHDRHDEVSVDGYSAEMINERLTQITKTVDENLNSTEEEIRRLRDSLEKSQKEHDNVRQEITNAENLKRLDDEKHNEQKEEINKLKEELEKERQEAKKRTEQEIKRLMESLEKANAEKDNYKSMYEKKCIIM
ncbi:immune-associated nucleotide-binding protein 9-like [Lolium rigidum]|uniref:immune-associated nucleotide-binding protein 9-like n=1 Tax=Lolium rigidum TaxID=89674 RepID=UPI001F5C9432|nr:immune-associated nucleotide-binding protein 9-like [Lolium rigidum]